MLIIVPMASEAEEIRDYDEHERLIRFERAHHVLERYLVARGVGDTLFVEERDEPEQHAAENGSEHGGEQILISYHGQVGFAALDEHLGAARDYKAGDGHYHDAGGEAYLLECVRDGDDIRALRRVGSKDGCDALRGLVAEGHCEAPEKIGREDPYVSCRFVSLERHIDEYDRRHDEQGKDRLCYHRFELAVFALRAVDHIADERVENCGENLRHEHENTDDCDVCAENRSVKLRLI